MKQQTNRQLAQFFGLTFIISWLLWLPPLLKSTLLPHLPDIAGLPGMFAPFGPMIAAFWLTYRENGRLGIKTLWRRAWQLRFDKKWLLPTVLLGPFLALATAGLLILSGHPIAWETAVPLTALGPLFGLIFFTNALPEEFGWRGYALDRLQQQHSALTASLILGLMWGLWHLPLHFIAGTTQEIIPVYQFVLQQMGLAILYTWLVNNTRGSILVAALFHAIANVSAAAVPFWTADLGRWLNFGILVVLAGIIVCRWGWER
ncbi:MAG: CPBP family intramembrane metalloprotease [Anaerolineales bacterium]|nr:CPBP family intramembrane metalloprotease [Anaerolineales bacterium]